MLPTIQTTQIITPFGSGYVPMQHSNLDSRFLPADLDDVVGAPGFSMFSEMLTSLGTMLSLK
jgi:hypothetical protein